MEKSIDSQVAKALGVVSGWATIKELLSLVRDRIDIPEDFRQTAVEDRLERVIRRQVKAREDADGLCEFESVKRRGEDGETERVYKQISLFDKEDYRRTIDYYSDRAYYNARKANSLTARCNVVLKTKRQVPFPGFGLLGEQKESA